MYTGSTHQILKSQLELCLNVRSRLYRRFQTELFRTVSWTKAKQKEEGVVKAVAVELRDEVGKERGKAMSRKHMPRLAAVLPHPIRQIPKRSWHRCQVRITVLILMILAQQVILQIRSFMVPGHKKNKNKNKNIYINLHTACT